VKADSQRQVTEQYAIVGRPECPQGQNKKSDEKQKALPVDKLVRMQCFCYCFFSDRMPGFHWEYPYCMVFKDSKNNPIIEGRMIIGREAKELPEKETTGPRNGSPADELNTRMRIRDLFFFRYEKCKTGHDKIQMTE
jgi:hypothetical protein